MLHFDQNEIRELSPWIRGLTALVDMSLSQNQLDTITEAIGELPNLKKLNLASNALLSVPPELCCVTGIVSLNLDNNPLRSPPQEVVDAGFGMTMEYFTRFYQSMQSHALHLVSMGLKTFPVEAQIYTKLEHIDVGDNLIEQLPKSVGNHPALLDLLPRRHALLVGHRLEPPAKKQL